MASHFFECIVLYVTLCVSYKRYSLVIRATKTVFGAQDKVFIWWPNSLPQKPHEK